MRRPRPKLLWIREALNNAAPGATNNDDLLASFRSQLLIGANLPGFTVERLHLRMSVVMTAGAGGANNGAAVSVWVDSINQTILQAFTRPFDQQWLVFDEFFVAEALQNGGVTPFNVVHTYDVRSRRKVQNVQDTVWIQTANIGTAVITSYSFVMSMLIRLH